jgi:hypothetical protein
MVSTLVRETGPKTGPKTGFAPHPDISDLGLSDSGRPSRTHRQTSAKRSSVMSNEASQVDVRGPRFAAWITTTILVLTLVVPLLGVIATAFALIASLLNAAFGICLGCQLYPFVSRFRRTAALLAAEREWGLNYLL